ncbi:toll/interleukin-1 receptor domain-containing protein [Roseivivax sp. CAU 1761]
MTEILSSDTAARSTDAPDESARAVTRRVLFLSHATPEDSTFAKWLASQLAIAGYEVWCDVTALLGGERFWDDIEEAIDQATFRFLFVSTLEANRKPGTLRELALAEKARVKHGLGDFIVPLKIDAFPFGSMHESVRDLNVMRFDFGWAEGLRRLLALLEREAAPKSPVTNASTVMDWYTRSIECDRKPVRANDSYLSNWFRLSLPKRLYAHRYRGPADTLFKVAASFPHPYRVVGQRLLTFAPEHEVVMALGDGWASDELAVLDTRSFVSDGAPALDIASFDASNMVSDLVRQAWEAEMTRRELCAFPLASGLVARFFANGHLEKNKAHFTPDRGRRTYRQLVGNKTRKIAGGEKVPDGYWHFGLSASPQLAPFPRIVLRYHVIFSDDGKTPWDKAERMHKARRGVCKQWWNAACRDRLLAFCAQFGDEANKLTIGTGGDPLVVSMKPERFISPVTYFEDGQAGLDETGEIELVEDDAGQDGEGGDGSAS